MRVEFEQGSESWLEWRSGGLGGSDIAAIMEEAKFSPTKEGYEAGFANSRRYGLWLLKTGKVQRSTPGKAMQAGTANEPKIREQYALAREFGGLGGPACFIYEDWPIARVSLDFWLGDHGQQHIAEFKNPQSEEEHRGAKEGEIPYYYWLQCQMEMAVADAATLDYVSWHDGDMQIIPVERNEEFWFCEMLPALQEFWSFVELNQYPALDGEVINDDPQITMALETIAAAKWRERQLKESQRSAYAILKRAMGTAKTLVCDGQKISWAQFKAQDRTTVTHLDPALQLRIGSKK